MPSGVGVTHNPQNVRTRHWSHGASFHEARSNVYPLTLHFSTSVNGPRGSTESPSGLRSDQRDWVSWTFEWTGATGSGGPWRTRTVQCPGVIPSVTFHSVLVLGTPLGVGIGVQGFHKDRDVPVPRGKNWLECFRFTRETCAPSASDTSFEKTEFFPSTESLFIRTPSWD